LLAPSTAQARPWHHGGWHHGWHGGWHHGWHGGWGWRGGWGWGGWGWGWGPAFATGVAIGAWPYYGYGCYVRPRVVITRHGHRVVRPVRVCY
jgi:hypothetical protein